MVKNYLIHVYSTNPNHDFNSINNLKINLSSFDQDFIEFNIYSERSIIFAIFKSFTRFLKVKAIPKAISKRKTCHSPNSR